VQVFPAQLSGAYSYKIGGELNELEKYGYWNAAMGELWLDQANIVVVYFSDEVNATSLVNPGSFVELEGTPGNLACFGGARLGIFERINN
ncbi:MAG: hypothetical protein N2D54_13160, partial [Chloroflexota bacterium]